MAKHELIFEHLSSISVNSI